MEHWPAFSEAALHSVQRALFSRFPKDSRGSASHAGTPLFAESAELPGVKLWSIIRWNDGGYSKC